VAASADTTNVNYSAGHGWLSSDTATSAPWPSSFAERPYSQPTTVALDRLPEAATSATFTNPGWVETFQSVNAAATRWGFTAGTSSLASGFTLDEPVAQVLSLNSGSTAPTGMWRLCSIPVTGGGNLMSATAGTSCPYSGVALGYVWTASTVPTYAEGDVLPIIRCHKGTSTANWISYTIREGATCASGFTLTLLGYGLRVGGLQTTSPVVDAAGSFSVSAQMLPAAPETQWTAIAGRTSTNVSFTLGVDAGGFWQFCVEGTCVTTAEAPDLSQGPVFVTGIRDVANDQIRIALKTNVDVQAVGYLSDSSGSLPSTLLVQSGFSDLPTPPQPWLGAADQISVFPGVVSSTQQQRLSGGSTPQP
jgi:hypothetical protein